MSLILMFIVGVMLVVFQSLSHLSLLQPHQLQPARLLCPWDSPGQNNGVGLPLPSPRNLPDPGIQIAFPTL